MPHIENVAESIYVVRDTGGGNIGLCIRRGKALVIDSGYLPRAAAAIKNEVEKKFGCRVELLFNTHYHSDHTFGNQAFDCPILSSSLCRKTMIDCLTSHWRQEEIEKAKAEDPKLVEEWKDLVITLPTTTFDNGLAYDFHGVNVLFRRVGGHTPDSSIVFFPDQGLLVAGDIVFGEAYPTLLEHDGDPEDMIRVLKMVAAMKVPVIMPGHGEVTGIPFVVKLIAYWEDLLTAAQEFLSKTGSEESVVELLVGCSHIPDVPFNELKHRRNARIAVKSVRERAAR